jgi:hypothetical protein
MGKLEDIIKSFCAILFWSSIISACLGRIDIAIFIAILNINLLISLILVLIKHNILKSQKETL